jgi:NSS family neurotransmitter:Na+ symporter
MGAFGNIVGAIWFFMLFLAAITSSMSMYQPSLAFFQEALGWSHSKATTLVAVLGTVGSLLTLWFTKDGAFWSTVDFWVGTLLIFVLAGVQIICFSWVFGIERGWKEIHSGAAIQIPTFFKIVMKYIAPAYLIIVFVAFCYQNLSQSLAAAWANTGSRVGVLVIVATLVFLLVVTRMGEQRWRAQGLDIDDKNPAD